MEFGTISPEKFSILIIIMILSLLFITGSTAVNLTYNKRKKHIAFNMALLAFTAINLIGILEANKYFAGRRLEDIKLTGEAILQIPYSIQCIIGAAIIVIAIVQIYGAFKYGKKNFYDSAVKEVIENLPTGVAFYNEKGFLSLSNEIMHNLSLELTNKDLQNGKEFRMDLNQLQDTKSCLIKGENPVFILENKSVWKFSNSIEEINGEKFTKLRADDITETYKLTETIEKENKKLREEQKKIKEYMNKLDEYIAEEETLKIKMMVHDDFGELIALTVRAYELGGTKEEKRAILQGWERLREKMKSLEANNWQYKASQENQEEEVYRESDVDEGRSLDRVLQFAKLLSCKVQIEGSIPEDPRQNELIIHAIYESVKNAVYHAKANKVSVVIRETEENVVLKIHNEDQKVPKTIIEGGGLSNLRKKTMKLGGSMEVLTHDGITLMLVLKKEC